MGWVAGGGTVRGSLGRRHRELLLVLRAPRWRCRSGLTCEAAGFSISSHRGSPWVLRLRLLPQRRPSLEWLHLVLGIWRQPRHDNDIFGVLRHARWACIRWQRKTGEDLPRLERYCPAAFSGGPLRHGGTACSSPSNNPTQKPHTVLNVSEDHWYRLTVRSTQRSVSEW